MAAGRDTRSGGARVERIILRSARVVDGRGLRHERADLLIEDDRIADIAPGG